MTPLYPAVILKTPLDAFRAAKRALERLTVKALGRGSLGKGPGDYCLVGALFLSVSLPEGCDQDACPPLDEVSTTEAITLMIGGDPLGPRGALDSMYMTNDLGHSSESPEQRYARVSAWVDERLAALAPTSSPDALEGDTPA